MTGSGHKTSAPRCAETRSVQKIVRLRTNPEPEISHPEDFRNLSFGIVFVFFRFHQHLIFDFL